MMTTLPANIQTALSDRNIDIAVWTTLQNSVFPGAKDESILLAVDYCKARKLDVLKKPCHIVPMQVTLSGEKDNYGNSKKIWRDVIMPGIYEQRITAFRTGQMAGEDEPIFGETITHLGVTAPEWCKVTVYRFINGERCAFSHTEYFAEACATTFEYENGQKTNKLKINSMWTKRPRGQLAKCAEAGALRKAFPDELGGVITADEISEDVQKEPIDVTPKSNVIEAQAVELVTAEQAQQIKQLLEITGTEAEKVLALCGVTAIEQIPAAHAVKVINKLNATLDAQTAKAPDDDNLGEDIPL
ncbi:phage recombination protein Bet [Pasteurellaceae bacterium USgator11]|nr:phage recombination protein Bet [Pasteurellaceae bacterium UScroc12]TNG94749.1 phage recombination protein Bet [Pasteurellaceae bacterium USgator41]TNG97720.1 phage recombination protein Bet [Pasteurellaceae bacterium UScroc31]TNH01681.1 phage recombination protein Bet [Pasteurellaceae bacterium USgator11]